MPYRNLSFRDAPLTTRFAVYSFLCIGLMTVALWFLVSNYLIAQMLKREWEATAKAVRADVKQMLTEHDFKAQDRKSVGHKFGALLEYMRRTPDIVRFKVYNPDGVVIWSDDKRLVGRSFTDNDELQQAMKGNVVADLSSLSKPENVFEQETVSRAVELYVPIYGEDGRELLGVFETYKRADSIYRDIREARLVVLLGALGGGLLLYVSLFAIVRQAAKKIAEQQENLLNMQSELVASQRMVVVGEMTAAVAHGIGNPLTSIRAAAQVGKLDCKESEGTQLRDKTETTLDAIVQQVDRVQRRMQGLLNFAKPMEPQPGSVELNTVLSDILHSLAPRFAAAGITTNLELDRNLPKARLDASHAEQIFTGLITNALEATPAGGRVTVRTAVHPGNGTAPIINVTIEDTGEGIPVDHRKRVFEPFFTTKPHGTGIGLPLAKKFVERNGGRIQMSDAPGGGARFDVTFTAEAAS